MRYSELLRETIVAPPRNMKIYLTNRIRELDRCIAELARADAMIKENESEGEYLLRYALKNSRENISDEDHDAASRVYNLLDARIGSDYQLDDLKMALEGYLKFGTDFRRYIDSTLGYVRSVDDATRRIITLLPGAEAGLASYGYESGNPENDNDPEYVAATRLIEACRIKALVIAEVERLQNDLKQKFAAIDHRHSHFWAKGGLDSYQPPHEEVETLYHATTHATEILRDGFLSQRPDDRKGVGSFGRQELISFAHDLEIARNIMRSFKEIWMIMHHQLRGDQIMRWAEAEGIETQLRDMWLSNESRTHPLPVARNADPVEIVKLYRLWQWCTKIRTNPVMTDMSDLARSLEHRKLSDIGVLACRVRLDPSDAYFHGESEFRVPPDRVLSVKRVL